MTDLMHTSLSSANAIHDAFAFEYKPNLLTNYYDGWASNYDQDVDNENYEGPAFITGFLSKLRRSSKLFLTQPDILDAGCGTGLVGKFLQQQGFEQVDGFDLSPQMVEYARKTGAYDNLIANYDMTQCNVSVIADGRYDIVVCCGVFTVGHVPPEALQELIRITRSGGVILLSTRKSYHDETGFSDYHQSLQREGKVRLLDSVMDGPYLKEEGAHYWLFQVA